MTDVPHPAVEWYQLRGFQRDCLVAICRLAARGKTPYGLAIKRELQGMRDAKVSHSQLYPNLEALVEDDWLVKGQVDDRTNHYRLTETAESLLEQQATALQALVESNAAAPVTDVVQEAGGDV